MTEKWQSIIVKELETAMSAIDEEQLDALVDALMTPNRRVLCVGVGRVLI